HDNGTQTYYGHNSSLLVSAGQKVYKGQAIAKAGSTGRSTGTHCHFEIRVKGTAVNPLNYLR
ncbi:MAG: M23 family metallopeptidase, partial [Lawsonibacter sp.]